MEKTTISVNADLQKFMDKFEPSKFKVLSRGLEIRGINDLHRNISEAKSIIEKMKLKLTVSHSADMLAYGGFEVNYV